MTQIQFPYLGNSLVMAIVILTHVFLAFIAVGGITIAVVSEYVGYTKKSLYHDLLAKKYMNFISNLMKVGGVFGTAIVVLLIGLFGEFTKTLFNIFFFPLLLEALMFFILFTSSIYYRESWDNTKNKKLHLFSGLVAALAGIIAAFIINAAWAFMLAPGNYFKNPSMASAMFNPLTFSSFVHLIIPCIINGAFFFFIYSFYKTKSKELEEEEKPFYKWAMGYTGKITATFILFQVVSGILFLLKIRAVDNSIFTKIVSGDTSTFFYSMITLATIAAISSIIFLLTRRQAYVILLIGGLAAYLAFPFGGYTRERARKPYLIHGYMYMNQKLAAPQSTKEVTEDNILAKHGCLSCHKFKGEGGTFGPNLTSIRLKLNKDQIKNILKNPPQGMPPFSGDDSDIEKIIETLQKSF